MEQDALARARITSEINSNFFVEAAAGSGKTSSLVDRMIAMVGAGIDVSRICAITFTKAAAKEFYGRFQEKLIERSGDAKTDAVLRARYAEALRNIDLCFMGTIDAFANMLLHEHPLEAGMPSETTVCAESEAKPQYLAEYAKIKRGGYGRELRDKYERFRAVQTNADDVFANCIGIFTARRESDFVYNPPEEIDVNTQYTNWKYWLVRTLKLLQAHPEYAGAVKDTQEKLKLLSRWIPALQAPWNEQIGNVLNALKQLDGIRLGKDGDGKLMTPDMIGVELPEAFALHENKRGKADYYHLNLLETDAYRTLKKLQYAATMDFLVSASKAIANEMRESGTMTFHDALLTLRDLLKTDAASGGRLIRHIANRHSYYLVDEFQDTDPLQAEIVFYLTAQEPKPDWTACIPRGGSLFIVGDPKQSIYRFRGADVSSFLRVRGLFEQGAGEALMLSRNFRSTTKLHQWFNQVFPEMLVETEHVQSAFHPIPISEDNKNNAYSGIYIYRSNVSPYGKLLDDAEQVTAVICRLIGNPAVRLKNGAPPQFRDIMIIAYRKKQTAEIAKALQAAGIPVRVEGQTDFADCPALTAAVRLFAAAAQPTDAMAVYGALTSDVFHIPEEAVKRFCSIGGRLNAFSEQKEQFAQFPSVQAALAKIQTYVLAGSGMDSAALLAWIADDMKLLAKTGSKSLEYYCYALELLRRAEANGTVICHADAAVFLRDLLTQSGEERCVSLSPDDNRVHIANLHKVKGLQAPIVILADPCAKDFNPDLRVIHRPDRTECRVFSLKSGNSVIAETDRFSSDFDDECECMTAEKLRLLYVAATRAENILIIGDSVKEKAAAAMTEIRGRHFCRMRRALLLHAFRRIRR